MGKYHKLLSLWSKVWLLEIISEVSQNICTKTLVKMGINYTYSVEKGIQQLTDFQHLHEMHLGLSVF